MATNLQLSRIAKRRDQVLEVQFGPIPEPPPEMEKLPGITTWFQQLKLSRERDVSSIERMLNNLNQQVAAASAASSTTGNDGRDGTDGANGAQGPPGPPGPPGANGTSGTAFGDIDGGAANEIFSGVFLNPVDGGSA